MTMEVLYFILAIILIVTALLPFLPNQHWICRIWEFGRIQLFFLQILAFLGGFFMVSDYHLYFWISQGVLLFFIVNNVFVLIPYTRFYKTPPCELVDKHSESISILSVNVYQFNKQYQRLINLIKEVQPDILITMESNKDWEDALSVLDKEYPTIKKVPLENTYGMHFYSRIKTNRLKVNYFVADDMPSIEAELETQNKIPFALFAVHPAPPSPTEEETSKERDGDLLCVAKKVKELGQPSIVVGDFNNVAWAKSSILFRKTSELIDPRIGRGFVSTFHADYRIIRFPIDLFFHSTDIIVEEFKVLQHVGSDHLPLYCRFFINLETHVQDDEVEELEEGEMEKVEEMIEEGKKEQSDRPAVAKE